MQSGDISAVSLLVVAVVYQPWDGRGAVRRHVAGIINIFNPECIIVGGTFAEAATYYFLHPMNDSIRKYSLRLMSNDIQVKTSILGERSGVIGACILARNRSFLEQYC